MELVWCERSFAIIPSPIGFGDLHTRSHVPRFAFGARDVALGMWCFIDARSATQQWQWLTYDKYSDIGSRHAGGKPRCHAPRGHQRDVKILHPVFPTTGRTPLCHADMWGVLTVIRIDGSHKRRAPIFSYFSSLAVPPRFNICSVDKRTEYYPYLYQ